MASAIQPTEEEKRELYALANNVPFDDRVNHQASLDELNITLIQQYLREVNSDLYKEAGRIDFRSLCRSMNLDSELPEYPHPKNVGLMFFSLDPHKYFLMRRSMLCSSRTIWVVTGSSKRYSRDRCTSSCGMHSSISAMR